MFVVRFGTYVVCFAYSVLVHSGGVHGGHYYAFIRPTLGDQWYVCVCVFFFFFLFFRCPFLTHATTLNFASMV
jgi:hypothetical protein